MRPAARLLPGALLLAPACRLSPSAQLDEPFEVRAQTLADTGTVPAGEFEVAAGVESEPFDGLATTAEVVAGLGPTTDAWVEVAPYLDPEDAGHGFGDTTLGMKHRFREQDDRGRPSLALLLEGKLPTAAEDRGLGSGEVDLGAGLVATRTWAENWIWWGYRAGFLGEETGAGTDLEHTLVIGGARRFASGAGGFVEADWIEAHELDQGSGTLKVGGVLAVTEGWSVDLGMSFGYGGGNEGERLFVGLTQGLRRALR